jgi:hypothetical protein
MGRSVATIKEVRSAFKILTGKRPSGRPRWSTILE